MRSTNIDWPEDVLGCPIRADYRGTVGAQFLRTEVEDGPARYRRVKNEQRRVYSVSFLWKQPQLLYWEGFYQNVLVSGLRWFMMPQLTGQGMRPMFCHMLGEWTITPHRDELRLTEVSFDVEAFLTSESMPPPSIFGRAYDGQTPADATVDIIDGRHVSVDPDPGNVIDSLSPGSL